MNIVSKTLIAIFILLLIANCSNKSSPFGFPGSKLENLHVMFDGSVFQQVEASQNLTQAFPLNTKLVLGNYKNTDARILLRFMNLPADVTLSVDPTISIAINNDYNPKEYNLKIAPLINFSFQQHQATWEHYDETNTWENPGGDFTHAKSFTYNFADMDSLKIFDFTIDKEIVQKWIDDSKENFGLILFTDDVTDSFIEFHSSETIYRPIIELTFFRNDEEIVETREVNHDTFIHNNQDTDFNKDVLNLSNIPPRSIYTKFDVSFNKNIKVYEEIGINNENELRRSNVNQAYLYIPVDIENSLITNTRINILSGIPYEIPPDRSSVWVYNTTVDTLRNNEMRINVTEALQRIISEDKPNNGLFLINNFENMDFSNISFKNDVRLSIYLSKLKN